MKLDDWLKQSIEKLKSASVPTARLDAEVLLADLLDKDRSWIHANPDFILRRSYLRKLDEQISRREKHEPLAYIRGKQEFYGRDFVVSSDTLTPRPETETMIEMLVKIKPSTIVDVGTGSGCIAITAKLELPDSKVYACDVSKECLEIAQRNSNNLKAEVEFYKSDLLQDINVKNISLSTLCCNLPYVPSEYKINDAAKHEPKIALFGGEDGLDYYRQLFEQVFIFPEQFKPSHILTESLKEQHEAVEMLAFQANYRLVSEVDLIQHFVYEYK